MKQIELFKHNQTAYDAMLDALAAKRQACIVQPTGTGKMMIALKYIEQHPDMSILIVSPSLFILRQQFASAKSMTESDMKNVDFVTYQLLASRRTSVSYVDYDCIILDEFHHIGADIWRLGIDALLDANEHAMIIGFTATVQRSDGIDMTDTLFSGIDYELTLPEAIARGILQSPVYVVADYMLEDEMNDVESKILSNTRCLNDDTAMSLLSSLKMHALDASNIDKVLSSHIKADAKAIVFCRNVKHMQSALRSARDLFKSVNDDIHVYATHSADPTGEFQFNAFVDDDADCLRLLYCVNQLNEGVHVKDVNTAIMLRPTRSRLVFMQQLGRVLTAAYSSEDDSQPLIIDLVDNINGKSWTGVIKREIENIELTMQDQVSGECQSHDKHMNDSDSDSDSDNIIHTFANSFKIVDYVEKPRTLISNLATIVNHHYDERDLDKLIDEYIELDKRVTTRR